MKVLKYWEGSPERLLDFWKKISSNSVLDYPLLLFKNTWDSYKQLSTQVFPYYKSGIDIRFPKMFYPMNYAVELTTYSVSD